MVSFVSVSFEVNMNSHISMSIPRTRRVYVFYVDLCHRGITNHLPFLSRLRSSEPGIPWLRECTLCTRPVNEHRTALRGSHESRIGYPFFHIRFCSVFCGPCGACSGRYRCREPLLLTPFGSRFHDNQLLHHFSISK